MCRSLFIIIAFVFIYSGFSRSEYNGSQAYNSSNNTMLSVNIATGSVSFSYPLVQTTGVHAPFTINLTYRYNAGGKFGLPMGWQFDLDFVHENTAHIGGQQWLIDPLWHDEQLYASGLKYYNQHGNSFHDAGVEKPIPGEEAQVYRYKSLHKDGSIKYFSGLGLLMMIKDRFGNKVVMEYELPVKKIEDARLVAVTDNYGNRYTVHYEPGAMIIHYPDKSQQRIFFNSQGVVAIFNQLGQEFTFNYERFSSYNLLKTLSTPSGLLTKLSYHTIPYKSDFGNGVLPVVSNYKQIDVATSKVHREINYVHSAGYNYTGYPLYSLSISGDGLMESNDANYRYSVEVAQINEESGEPKINHKVYEFNFLHLPVEVRILKEESNFLRVRYEYAISPFKCSRSTNYDKPANIEYSIWHTAENSYIPSNRTERSYDLFGNKTMESYFIYHRDKQYWRPIRSVNHNYFTDHYSLLAETVRKDLVSGKGIKKIFELSPSKKNHSKKTIFGLENNQLNLWRPWKQANYLYDELGRNVSTELTWAAKGMPGLQKTVKKKRYVFDKNVGMLTTHYENSSGHVHQVLVDTRNNRVVTEISPLGQRTEFRYDELGQVVEHTDPDGNIYKVEHFSFIQDGLNAKVTKSPLGFTKRQQQDASGRTTIKEELFDGKYQVVEELTYNVFGKVAAHKNRFGFVNTYEYDDQLRLIKQQDPWQNKMRVVYDDDNSSQETYFNGRMFRKIKKIPWLLEHQSTHYPLTDQGSATRTVTQESVKKNGFGQVVLEQSVLLNSQSGAKCNAVTQYSEYDTGNNQTKLTIHGFDGVSLTKNVIYDLFNNVYTHSKTQNDNGEISNHLGYLSIYNADNRLQRTETPKSEGVKPLITHYYYDKNGREIERKLPDGNTIRSEYNGRGLVTSISTKRRGKEYHSFHQYDADGQLTQVYDSDGRQQSYQYDERGLLTRRIYPDRRLQKYEYDLTGRRIRQESAGKRVLSYRYDDKDRGKLSAITSGQHQVLFTYGKDDNGVKGRLLGVTRDMPGAGKTNESHTYDGFGRLARTHVTNVENKPVFVKDYRYYPRGQIKKMVNQSWTEDKRHITDKSTYKYDGLQRLIKEKQQLTVDSSTAPKLTQNQEISYQYDGNNNLIKEQKNTDRPQTTQYFYNAIDQLVAMKKGASNKKLLLSHDANGHIATDHRGNKYQYDGFGLLETVRDANDKLLVEFYYLPDGMLGRVHNEKSHQDFYYDSNFRVQSYSKDQKWHDFIAYGNQYLGTLSGNSAEQLFLANQSTGARLGVDEKGKMSSTVFLYEGYGQSKLVGDAASQTSTDFLWNQEFMEKESGLVYLRHRFYHPELKRFISRDDLHVDNRYVYARSNPINFIDPMGTNALRMTRYIGGGTMIIFSLLGGFLALSSAGASLPLSATLASGLGVVAGALGALSGAVMIGSQALQDSGYKEVVKLLDYVNIGLFALSFIGFFVALPVTFSNKVAVQAAQLSGSGSLVEEGEQGVSIEMSSLLPNVVFGEEVSAPGCGVGTSTNFLGELQNDLESSLEQSMSESSIEYVTSDSETLTREAEKARIYKLAIRNKKEIVVPTSIRRSAASTYTGRQVRFFDPLSAAEPPSSGSSAKVIGTGATAESYAVPVVDNPSNFTWQQRFPDRTLLPNKMNRPEVVSIWL